jgi:signal transduction histidine kinase
MDQEWMESGIHRSARYSQLAPGRYLFQVIACNRDGVWNRQGASLAVTVPPFWWETSWFRVGAPLAVAGVLMGLLVIALRQRHRRQLERLELQHATEEERARIARDMHDELGSYLTRIVMISESEPESPTGSSETGAALKEINQAGREMTVKMSEIVWALNPAHDSLDSFAGYVAKRAHELLSAAKIHCRLDLPVDLPASPLSSPVRHEVLLAFKEALHNILKHAQAKSVLISLRLEGESFVLTVKDDGKGFVVHPEAPAQGNGLTNMRHRLAEVGGCCEVVSQPGQGTCIRFIVPLQTKK